MNKKGLFSEDIYKFHLKLSQNPNMRIFRYQEYKKSRDILAIAFAVFKLEKEIKKKDIDKLLIERFVENHNYKLKKILSELISYVLLEDVRIKFFHSKEKLNKKKFNFDKLTTPKAVVLFSGGIDSFSGILWAKENFDNDIRGIFCAHSDQAWNIHIVNSLSKRVLTPANIKMETINVPAITKGGYSQLRGFLYIVSAGAWMELLNADNLIISECGPTMYQPRFGPYDKVTMTTHPIVVGAAHSVLELLLGRKIKILIPFENMTKAEAIAFSRLKGELRNTHSCVSLRLGRHDGTCYGCIIRRLGALVAGVEDVKYDRDPITEEKANKENLISLLNFSLDLLFNYKDMPLYATENIEAYNKIDLFRRFALDNFAAIHILKEKGININNEIKYLYEDCLGKIGTDILDKRIEDVRNKKFYISKKPINQF